jgi:hypothetical protein
MYRILIAGLMFVSATGFAQTPEGVTRGSPMTSFTTHKTSDVFAQCVIDAVKTEFPASRIEPVTAGHQILISRAPSTDAVAVIDIRDGELPRTSMVTIRSASAAQPRKDATVKSARNCQ